MPHVIGSYITDSDLKDGTVLLWYLPTLVPTWTVTNCGTSLKPPQTASLSCCGTTPSDLKFLGADPDSSSQLKFTAPTRHA